MLVVYLVTLTHTTRAATSSSSRAFRPACGRVECRVDGVAAAPSMLSRASRRRRRVDGVAADAQPVRHRRDSPSVHATRGLVSRSERPQNKKRKHPRHRVLDTSHMEGTSTPQNAASALLPVLGLLLVAQNPVISYNISVQVPHHDHGHHDRQEQHDE